MATVRVFNHHVHTTFSWLALADAAERDWVAMRFAAPIIVIDQLQARRNDIEGRERDKCAAEDHCDLPASMNDCRH